MTDGVMRASVSGEAARCWCGGGGGVAAGAIDGDGGAEAILARGCVVLTAPAAAAGGVAPLAVGGASRLPSRSTERHSMMASRATGAMRW